MSFLLSMKLFIIAFTLFCVSVFGLDIKEEYESFGIKLEDDNLMQKILKYVSEYKMPSIVVYDDEDAECYFIGDACIFHFNNTNIELNFNDVMPEYVLHIEYNSSKRRLKGESCETFDEIMSLWKKKITCDITEYAHVIKIINI